MDNNKYETFRRDVHIWSKLSTLPKKKQALDIHLTLRGWTKNASFQLTDAQLESDDGVELVFEKLDALFLPDKSRRQFSAFNKLYNLRRPEATAIRDSIGEFDYTYHEFTQQDLTLPDSVMAFMLLSSCNFSEEETRLVISAVTNVTNASMKSSIMRYFEGGFTKQQCATNSDSITVKSEQTFTGFHDGSDVDVLQFCFITLY